MRAAAKNRTKVIDEESFRDMLLYEDSVIDDKIEKMKEEIVRNLLSKITNIGGMIGDVRVCSFEAFSDSEDLTSCAFSIDTVDSIKNDDSNSRGLRTIKVIIRSFC